MHFAVRSVLRPSPTARRWLTERLVRLRWRLRRIGDHRITFLAASAAEHAHFRRVGLPTLYVNNGAFTDERIFRPLRSRQARFDAVYDARLSPFKRHPLAAEVPNLALVTYLYQGQVDPGYRAAIAPILARAHVFNGNPSSDAYRALTPEEVNHALNQCGVGLALSKEEGAMYASQGCDRKFSAEWPSLFVNKLLAQERDPTAGILAAIERAHAR